MGSKKWGNTGMDDKCACFIAGAHRPIQSFISKVSVSNQKAMQIEDAAGRAPLVRLSGYGGI